MVTMMSGHLGLWPKSREFILQVEYLWQKSEECPSGCCWEITFKQYMRLHPQMDEWTTPTHEAASHNYRRHKRNRKKQNCLCPSRNDKKGMDVVKYRIWHSAGTRADAKKMGKNMSPDVSVCSQWQLAALKLVCSDFDGMNLSGSAVTQKCKVLSSSV